MQKLYDSIIMVWLGVLEYFVKMNKDRGCMIV